MSAAPARKGLAQNAARKGLTQKLEGKGKGLMSKNKRAYQNLMSDDEGMFGESDDEGNKENTGSTAVQADKKRKPGALEQKQPEVKKTKLGVEAKPKRMPLGEKRQPEAGLKMKSKPEGNPLKRVASKKDVDVEKTSAKPESKAEVLEQEKQVKVENKPEPEPVSRPANKALPIRAKANISKAADEEIANIPDKLRGYVVQEANTEVLQHVVKNSNTRCAEIKALIAAR